MSFRSSRKNRIDRRRFLGTAATGAAALSLGCSRDPKQAVAPAVVGSLGVDDELRLAVIGTGRRGQDHLWALGCEDPASKLAQRKAIEHDPIPGVRVVAVCDTFDPNLEVGANQVKAAYGSVATYVDYRELLENEDLDGVVIATPDHMHAPIAMDAAKEGADVYVEKSITNNLEETLELERVLEETGRILQAGFQTEQDNLHLQAKRVIAEGHIGKVHMVQGFLHRGGEEGAWVPRESKGDGPPREWVHWEEFLGGVAPERPYDNKRYFGWRRYWDYSTGISGDLFTHSLNGTVHLVGVGVPDSVVAMGGVLMWKDGRETPDTFSVICEYPDDDLQVCFLSTLTSGFPNQTARILGSDGYIELDWRLRVYADRWSAKYADQIASGALKVNKPYIDIQDSAAGMVVNAAPSQTWLQGRGATLTTGQGGIVRDTTRLHLEEFVASIRSREQPSASFEHSFPATIGAHMATASLREERRVTWDPVGRRFA